MEGRLTYVGVIFGRMGGRVGLDRQTFKEIDGIDV